MFSEKFKKNAPQIVQYFETLFKSDVLKMPQSVILYGLNSNEQYEFALNIARILNCEGDKSYNCNCRNCRWIRDNAHPAVVTCSNLESKTKTKSNISIEQITEIINSIIISSDYKRVFIFTGATEEAEEEYISDFKMPQQKKWSAIPLNSSILRDDASNALLKSLEEPTQNTYFIFLTRDKNDLISTIISRSQCFYIPSTIKEVIIPKDFSDLFELYPFEDFDSVYTFIENLKNWQTNNNKSSVQMFEYLQNYFKKLLEDNYKNTLIKKDIITVERITKQAITQIKDNLLYENLCYSLLENRNITE